MTKRNYELLLVLSPELDENGLETLIDRIKRFLDNAQSNVLSFKSWGMRRLAYQIQGHREGRYYLVQFAGESENSSELERNLIFTEGILRHMLTIAVAPITEEPAVAEKVVAKETLAQEDSASDEEEDFSTSEKD